MAVARLSTGVAAQTTGAACTVSHSIALLRHTTVELAFLCLSVSSDSEDTSCAVTLGGVPMVQHSFGLTGSGTNRGAWGIYYMFRPPATTFDVVATPGGTSTKTGVRMVPIGYSGVQSIGPLQSAAALSLNATTALNGRTVCGVVNAKVMVMTTSGGEQRADLGLTVDGCGDWFQCHDITGTGGEITFSMSGPADNPAMFAISLLPYRIPPYKHDVAVHHASLY